MSYLEVITGVTPESEEMLVAEMCVNNAHTSFVFVLPEGSALELVARTLAFFDKTRHIILFPTWDVVPFKKISPSNLVMTARIKGLQDLINCTNFTKPYILLTTANAITQKVLPKDTVPGMILEIKPEQTIYMDFLVQHLAVHGYVRLSAVREIGSFTVRGEIIDIFQPTDHRPIRIGFENDVVEYIKPFSPDTQITYAETLSSLIIYPASEVIKSEQNVQRFHERYIQLNVDAVLTEAMLTGQKFVGEEQFLPLFQEKPLKTLFDYIPGAKLVLGESTLQNITEHITKIWSEHEASPCTICPDEMFLDLQNLKQKTDNFYKILFCRLCHTTQSELLKSNKEVTVTPNKLDTVPNFRYLATEQKTDVFTATANYIRDTQTPVIFACYSEGSLQYITDKFKLHDIHLSQVQHYSDVANAYNIGIFPARCSIITKHAIVITEYSMLKREFSKTVSTVISEESNLTVGDVVVHRDYGIGIFSALKTIAVCNDEHDFVEILYRNNDKLFVPVEDIDLVTKYGTHTEVTLDKLGNASWQERQARLKKRIKDIAQTLLRSQAMRTLTEGSRFYTNQKYLDFCKEFPYVETEDQLKAIADVENDLASGKIMDRLICGDVGFGKTEIAMRAAFLIISEDPTKQVAVIVPTTLLCNQHLTSFRERFQKYNINIQQLSKTTARHRAKIKAGLEEGSINIIIGTNALLSEDIKFFDLNLLIIDEEQHAGVQQKEKLRTFKHNVHLLSLSATPIPRTLHMSLTGIKDLSVLRTPPKGRTAIDIAIIHYDSKIIKTAILNEIARGGRVFFTCPFISNIEDLLERLKKLLPEIRVEVAHGKTPVKTLNRIMSDFYYGKFSILLTTSIIESGIDIPFANTIIIYNADMFGLAQLYQLKGRVGRGSKKGYAYFIVSNTIRDNSPGMQRLESVKSLNNTGSGFSLALQDMDMRGFGNLIGEEQSGDIKEVGIELYHKMVEEEIAACKQQCATSKSYTVKIDLKANIRIPEAYIQELDLRMRVYRKISSLKIDEIESYLLELANRFGTPPQEVINLLEVIHIKQLCALMGIAEVTQIANSVALILTQNTPVSEGVLRHLIQNPHIFTIQGSGVKISVPDSEMHNVPTFILSHLITMRNVQCSKVSPCR